MQAVTTNLNCLTLRVSYIKLDCQYYRMYAEIYILYILNVLLQNQSGVYLNSSIISILRCFQCIIIHEYFGTLVKAIYLYQIPVTESLATITRGYLFSEVTFLDI